MAGAIGPGDWVECVSNPNANPRVAVGSLYRVNEIIPSWGPCPLCADTDTQALTFEGHPIERNWLGRQLGWCPCRFRPIYRPKAEFTTSLLRKATEPSELEPA
jgi:hypothetical protein